MSFASVKGRKRSPYAVEIYLFPVGPDDGMAFESHCSCPYGYQCKHGAAVLLSLAQEASRERPQTGATSPELVKWQGELDRRLSPPPQLSAPICIIGPGNRIEFVRVREARYGVVAATRDVTELRGIVKVKNAVSVEK